MTYVDSIIANKNDKPNVNGTNKKWYREVAANCQRDKSTTASEIINSPMELWSCKPELEINGTGYKVNPCPLRLNQHI